MNIVVTGASGFLGRHLIPILRNHYPQNKVIGLNSKDYNLLDPIQVNRMFEEQKPGILIHLAAYSGGIGANKKFPADFFYINSLLTNLVFEAAARFSIKKMIYTMGGCSYPAKAKSPIGEEQMWEGYPQDESAGYSISKKMGIVASRCYRNQYGLNSIVLIPGNMYGEYDNFRNEESHVIPGMLRKFFEAQLNNINEVVMWGSGSPTRDFIYAGDVAKCFPYFIENYNSSEPINISTGTSTSIKELANTIKEIIGYKGDIIWDQSKPDGQLVKIFDPSKLRTLGLSCDTTLPAGIRKTFEWLKDNYFQKSDGIRL